MAQAERRRPGQAHRRVHPEQPAVLGLRHARVRLGPGAVHVPALDHGDPVEPEPQHDPPQRLDPAGLLLRARPAGPARLGGDRRRHQADRPRRQAERPAGHPAAVRGHVPELVRRRGLRGRGDRCPRPGGDHVDRGSQHLHPQHLQGVDQARRHARPGGQGRQAGLVAGQGVRAGLRPHPGQAERDQLPAPRWHLDPADASPRSSSASTPAGSTGGRCSAGWAVGMVYGTITAYNVINPATGNHFGGSLAKIPMHRQDGLHRDDGVRDQPASSPSS